MTNKSMKINRCKKESFIVIGKEGATTDGADFIQKLWDDANSHFREVQHLAKKDENGNIFIIESIGMVNYRDRESINNYTKHAEIILKGDIKKLGKNLEIVEF